MSPSPSSERTLRNQLFRDYSPESRKASSLLEQNKIDFQDLIKGKDFRDCDFDLPSLFSTIGTFQGLEEIEAFVRLKLP